MSDQLEVWRARALAVGCAPLVDAMGRTHTHRAHLPAFRSPACRDGGPLDRNPRSNAWP